MTKAVCLKILNSKLLTERKVFLLPVYRRKVTKLMAVLLKLARAELIVLSKESDDIYKRCLPNRIHYVKAGVDTKRVLSYYCVSSPGRELRRKYGYDMNKTLVLHVGHMVEARNIRKLMDLNKNFQIVLLVSTSTRWTTNSMKICQSVKI